MWASGSARTQIVKQDDSSSSSVAGSVTIEPEVAITNSLCSDSTRSSASRSARRKVSWPNNWKISVSDVPVMRSISRSSSMKGTSSFLASERPSVDLPPPRSPISAMRERREA